jgi:hypothetical protein
MCDLHGRPAHVEHRGEEAVVENFYEAVVGVGGAQETVLEDEDETHNHDYESETVPNGISVN